jgi:3-oxoacyl-(acyl-carrier-protein) synthase
VRPLAITGLGVASPLGLGWDAFRAALAAPPGAAFTTAPTSFGAAAHPALRVAEIAGFDPRPVVGDKGLRNNDRLTRLLLVAARLGLEHAGLKRGGAFVELGPTDVGVCASTAYGSLEAIHELDAVARLEDPRYLNPARFPNTVINSSVGYVSIWEELRALNATVTNGPTGGLDAFDAASLWLDAGRAKAVLTGGGEAMSEGLWHAFRRLGALDESPELWSPGDPRSRGLRLGEGACLVALEELAAARARGATVHAEVVGYGAAFEPAGEGQPMVHVSATALARAVTAALAGLDRARVTMAVSGLSGLPALDGPERAALAESLGGVEVRCPKAWLGETLGAAGAFGAAAAAGWLADGRAGDCAVVTSVGFYGNASALVVRRPE